MFKPFVCFVLVASIVCPYSISALEIKHISLREGSQLDQYAVDLLKFIVEVSGEEAELVPFVDSGSQTRRQLQMMRGSYDVDWFGATEEIESRVVPIRYPILRGLLGHRVFITNRETYSVINRAMPFSELKTFGLIQGQGWGDIVILANSGFKKISVTADYDNIFRMIQSNRASLFPRSIVEPYGELSSRCSLDRSNRCTDKNMMVDDKLLLVYKLPMFFFISPHRQDLVKMFNSAFENHYDEFLVFFRNYPLVKDALSKLENRSVFRINENNFLSEETNRIDDFYWLETYEVDVTKARSTD